MDLSLFTSYINHVHYSKSIIMKESSATQYVLIPKNIFDRFFKEVKVGKKRISGILDETAVKQAVKRRKQQERKRRKSSSSESDSTESETESSE